MNAIWRSVKNHEERSDEYVTAGKRCTGATFFPARVFLNTFFESKKSIESKYSKKIRIFAKNSHTNGYEVYVLLVQHLHNTHSI